MNHTVFSRPTSAAFGKSTETIKCMVPLEVKDAFVRKLREIGYPSESDALRELVMCFVFGSDFLTRVHAERIRALGQNLAGIGTEDVQP